MRSLHILVPMAGLGSRFAGGQYQLPKPLIPVDGIPMFVHAIRSLGVLRGKESKITFCILQEHIDRFHINRLIEQYVPGAECFSLDSVTRGAAETCWRAREHLCKDDGLLILDCDMSFTSPEFENEIQRTLNTDSNITAGALVTFTSSESRYSYVETNAEGHAIRTKEKFPISNRAIAGAYFFSSVRVFLNAAELYLNGQCESSLKEYYISPMYNTIIQNNGTVRVTECATYHSFGTPEELASYLKIKNNSYEI